MRRVVGAHGRFWAALATTVATASLAYAQQATLGGHARRPYRSGLRRRLESRRQDDRHGGVRQHGSALGRRDAEES